MRKLTLPEEINVSEIKSGEINFLEEINWFPKLNRGKLTLISSLRGGILTAIARYTLCTAKNNQLDVVKLLIDKVNDVNPEYKGKVF